MSEVIAYCDGKPRRHKAAWIEGANVVYRSSTIERLANGKIAHVEGETVSLPIATIRSNSGTLGVNVFCHGVNYQLPLVDALERHEAGKKAITLRHAGLR